MPQINRIRVNNVKYNFGTQFYDDFLMRFSCKNTIYDLANGGGKSVLMLLLLQTMLPNCTLDEKQPVEKLFATAEGSTTIHSLVEWKLDSCDVKNGYRYMTCGFCARKGRSAEDDEQPGQNTGIEYFNYCIFYREFGDNDIKNLPLSNGKERITYNGLKGYLKELEKKDLGAKVYIFERKGEYQSFINNYGIYESHWEIVRGINKTEGHVRTYFENNYKTTRKVVEDLLIEEIIEKSYNNRIRGGSSDDEMAKTLLDIKDKLLELAKRREEISCYEEQIKLISDFSSKVGGFGEIYARREAGKLKLLTCLVRAKAQVERGEKRAAELADRTGRLKAAVLDEEKLIALADIAGEELELRELRELVDNLNYELKRLSDEYEACKKELALAQTAEDYRDYVQHDSTMAQLKEYMENCHKGQEEVTTQLKQLAAAKNGYMQSNLDSYEKSLKHLLSREEESREALEGLKENFRNKDNECARYDGKIISLKKQAEELENSIKDKMKGTSLLVSDRAGQEAAEHEEQLAALKVKLKALIDEEEELKKKQEYCMRERANLDAELTMQSDNIERLEKEYKQTKARQEELTALAKVYGEQDVKQLLAVMERIYDDMLTERESLRRKAAGYEKYIKAIESASPSDTEGVRALQDYLENRYPDRTISGAEYLRGRTKEECSALAAHFPYLPYSVLVKENYEEVCSDKNIMAIDCGVVPLLQLKEVEAVLSEETADAAETYGDGGRDRVLACLDMSFIYDEAGRQSGLKKVKEEAEQSRAELIRLEDRLLVVRGDYEKVSAYSCLNLPDMLDTACELNKSKQAHTALVEKKDKLTGLAQDLSERAGELSERRGRLEEAVVCESEAKEKLLDIAGLNDSLNACLTKIRNSQVEKDSALKARKLSKELIEGREKAYNELVTRRNGVENSIYELNKRWELYAPFYSEAEADGQAAALMPEKELDARFDALRQILTEEAGDLSDKERLMENSRRAMEKIVRSMQYRGITIEEAQKLYATGSLQIKSHSDILAITSRQEKAGQEIKRAENELGSASAQMNRVEGSVAHAKRSLTERYGEYEEMEINNPREFAAQHKRELDRVKKELKEAGRLEKENSRSLTSCMLMEKDLERIVKSVGFDLNELKMDDAAGSDVSLSLEPELSDREYEEAGKHFEQILKDEQKKKASFVRERDMLIQSLTGIRAYELAEEIKQSVQPPENQADADALMAVLKDTADCIALERDRIGRGIEDMELIKDNFENRCVQICSNIRSELERLGKLSKITMDDEVIPMLSLQIPYIKEEMYKDRMSVYINETVSAAENFKSTDEKLKYIRNRLAWKRLFSVIVTDMNSIRLNLYKRERIKDQSRYLRYEEAVGSTGQSQGIYIQFLISIINYIANINAGGKEASVLGKTIFIDNPFGAAKDIYIWEPIFKLLKTNHVQLIVPARGATPAITGRFDVNYVLGQKMVDSRQQTVVVDYHSQVEDSQLEYERLTFSQESFDFL